MFYRTASLGLVLKTRSEGMNPESLLDSGVVPLSGTPQNDHNANVKKNVVIIYIRASCE